MKLFENGLRIVNNAGISAFGDVEWTSVDIYKRVSTFPLTSNNILISKSNNFLVSIIYLFIIA